MMTTRESASSLAGSRGPSVPHRSRPVTRRSRSSAEASLASAWKVGLLDKIVLHSRRSSSAPVFGSFGDEGAEQVELERVSFGVADRLTDLRFRVQS
jgi:hypothetical protein